MRVALLIGLILWLAPPAAASPPMHVLHGTFVLDQPSCVGGSPHGSWLQVAYGTLVYRNPSSACAGGAFTLISPGAGGLATDVFTPDPVPTFDAARNSLSGTIIHPTSFDGHRFGIATSPHDVQRDPTGPPAFGPPVAVAQGTTLVVDLRSLDVTYRGKAGSNCASAVAVGCWEEGSRAASGSYDQRTHAFGIEWFASQSFTGQSAGVTFHLEGHFVGTYAEIVAPGAAPVTTVAQPAPVLPPKAHRLAAPAAGNRPAATSLLPWAAVAIALNLGVGLGAARLVHTAGPRVRPRRRGGVP